MFITTMMMMMMMTTTTMMMLKMTMMMTPMTMAGYYRSMHPYITTQRTDHGRILEKFILPFPGQHLSNKMEKFKIDGLGCHDNDWSSLIIAQAGVVLWRLHIMIVILTIAH